MHAEQEVKLEHDIKTFGTSGGLAIKVRRFFPLDNSMPGVLFSHVWLRTSGDSHMRGGENLPKIVKKSRRWANFVFTWRRH